MEEKMKKLVMVAIDESESSYHSLIWVLKNLKDSIKSSRLFIFAPQTLPLFNHSVFSAPLAYAQMFFPSSANVTWMAQEQNRKVALGLLEKAKRICGRAGIKAETFTEAGDPKEAICRAVEKHKIDLLVIGDQNPGFLKRNSQGSLSHCSLDNAKCSVLILRK